jgi:hypothetical protein
MENVCIFYDYSEFLKAVWYYLWPFGIIYGRLVLFMAVWYSLWSFGIFFPIWNVWTKKNLPTLVLRGPYQGSI